MRINDCLGEEFLGGKTYVTINIPEEADEVAYKTIVYSKPVFLPPVSLSEVNGAQIFSYDVTADRYLRVSMLPSAMTPAEFVTFMKNLTDALLKCDDYFMNPLNLLIDDELIYVNPTTFNVRLLYVPVAEPVQTDADICSQLSRITRRFAKTTDQEWQIIITRLWNMSESTPVYEAGELFTALYDEFHENRTAVDELFGSSDTANRNAQSRKMPQGEGYGRGQGQSTGGYGAAGGNGYGYAGAGGNGYGYAAAGGNGYGYAGAGGSSSGYGGAGGSGGGYGGAGGSGYGGAGGSGTDYDYGSHAMEQGAASDFRGKSQEGAHNKAYDRSNDRSYDAPNDRSYGTTHDKSHDAFHENAQTKTETQGKPEKRGGLFSKKSDTAKKPETGSFFSSKPPGGKPTGGMMPGSGGSLADNEVRDSRADMKDANDNKKASKFTKEPKPSKEPKPAKEPKPPKEPKPAKEPKSGFFGLGSKAPRTAAGPAFNGTQGSAGAAAEYDDESTRPPVSAMNRSHPGEDSDITQPPRGFTSVTSARLDFNGDRRAHYIPQTIRVELHNGTFTIGRIKNGKNTCDFAFSDQTPGVSYIHARIVYKDNDYYITDLNSTYGTYTDHYKIEPMREVKLTGGECISFGTDVEYVFTIERGR